MKRATVGMIATAVLAVATMAFAQAKPDFSGTWAPDAAAAPAGTGGQLRPAAVRRRRRRRWRWRPGHGGAR